MDALHKYRRRNKDLQCLIDELHYRLHLAEPFEGARVRAVRKRHFLKLFKYKRRAKGVSLSHS